MKPQQADSIIGKIMRQALQIIVRLPQPLMVGLFDEPPRNDRGAPLDLQTHILLSTMDATGSPRLEQLGPDLAREVYRRASQTFDLEAIELHQVKDIKIAGPESMLNARIYRPSEGKLPAVVFFHGGGFTIGCCDTYDGFCRNFAERTDCTVISVEYRLAPEYPFPAAVDDAVASFRWVHDHADHLSVDRDRIALAGDSAGATLATVVCHEQLAAGAPLPHHQLLLYPKTDPRKERFPSRELFKEGYYLTGPALDWFTDNYLADADRLDPRSAPNLYEDLQGLPPTTLITAGFDPLRDEGEAYAERLKEAGVVVKQRSYDQLIHGFISLGGIIDAAAYAVADLSEEFRREMGKEN